MKQVTRLKLCAPILVALLWGCGQAPSEGTSADATVTSPPPMGRSVSLGAERNVVFAEELKKQNVAYQVISYQDQEFIAWSPESDEVADAALKAMDVNPQGLLEMKKMRDAADVEARDRTSPSR